jgi:hypothetical protein
VFDDSVDMSAQARFAMQFCAAESCGKCTPCRLGSTRGVEVLDRIRARSGRVADAVETLPQIHNARKAARTLDDEIALLEDLCETMKFGSLCALGGFTPYPVLSALRHFPEDFGATRPPRRRNDRSSVRRGLRQAQPERVSRVRKPTSVRPEPVEGRWHCAAGFDKLSPNGIQEKPHPRFALSLSKGAGVALAGGLASTGSARTAFKHHKPHPPFALSLSKGAEPGAKVRP